MTDVLAFFYALFVTVPPLFFISFFFAWKAMGQTRMSAVKKAADWSTPGFMLAVHYQTTVLWDIASFWFIIIIFLATMIVFTIVHWRKSEEVQLAAMMKSAWRFQFLLFFLIYGALLFYGFIRPII